MVKFRVACVLAIAACQTSPETTSEVDQDLTSCVDLVATRDATLAKTQLHRNFGHEHTLRLDKHEEALVGFDLSSIPAAAAINSATLSLYVSDIGCDDSIDVHAATASWAESTVTFASFGQHFAPQIAGSIVAHYGNVRKSVDIVPLVRSWIGGTKPNDGVVLTGITHGDATLVSREGGTASQKPTLHVCYSVPDNHCATNPCGNGGTCENNPTSYTCACAPGFTGTNCEVNIDDCAGAPCQNGGTCTDGANHYTCACSAGYAGANCETNIDECASAPCQHGGTCEDGIAAYTCYCAAGYDGDNCEHDVDDCGSAPCQNGGTCADGVASYTCTCPTGFTGVNCEINIDDCAANPCHAGACVDGVAAFSCVCPPDWGGATCDVNLDTCGQHPCMNGATCSNGFGSYTCGCAPGFTGTNCEIDIDDCAGNPCDNGGHCIDGVNSFTCACPAGVGGARCDDTLATWIHATSGDGVETVVWGAVGNATSYGVTSDAQSQQIGAADCVAGICSAQFYITGVTDNHIAVTATNGVGTTALGTVITTPLADAPVSGVFPHALAEQRFGVVTTRVGWELGVVGSTLQLIEIDPVTGADHVWSTTTVKDETYTTLPYPPTYCIGDFICETDIVLPAGTHVLQLAVSTTVPTARTVPFVVTVPSLDLVPPPAPTGLRLVSLTATTATLSWVPSSAPDVVGYSIPGTCTAVLCTGQVTGLRPGVSYTFTVSAVDQSGNSSPPSNSVSGVPGTTGPLSAPTIISLTPDDNMLRVRFSAVGSEQPGKLHVLYRAGGGAEQDLVVLPGSCNAGNVSCETWIQGLASVSYTVQVQAEGAPGNFSARSAAATATPTPTPVAQLDESGCFNVGHQKVRVSIMELFEAVWGRSAFPPDLASFTVRIHAAYPINDSHGAFTGSYSYVDTDTSVPASTCSSSSSCSPIVPFPGDADLNASRVEVIGIDQAGNVPPFLFSAGIGFPDCNGYCGCSNF